MPAFVSAILVLGALLFSTLSLQAQTAIAPPRTLQELKDETLARVERGGYPGLGLKVEDARDALSRINSLDRDEWANAWSAIGDRYVAMAKQASGSAARDSFYRAFQYYSMARFPTPNSPAKRAAYDKAVATYLDYAAFDMPKLEVVRIPFEGKEIVGYLRLPEGPRPAPLMIMWGGLDFLKEQSADLLLPIVREDGFAALSIDMPGTGQAPIKVSPTAERMYSAVIDYIRTRQEIDPRKIFVWGASWGGYWATKVAVVEKDRIAGAIDQGGPIDVYFRPEWQMKALGTREYLMDLLAARSAIYENVNTLDEFLAACSKMSLLAMGVLDRPSAPLLAFNGARDSQVPIEDLTLLLLHGSIKEAWVNPEGNHVGMAKGWPPNRMTKEIVMPWVRKILTQADSTH